MNLCKCGRPVRAKNQRNCAPCHAEVQRQARRKPHKPTAEMLLAGAAQMDRSVSLEDRFTTAQNVYAAMEKERIRKR